MNDAVGRVVVFGDGVPAATAALAVSRALGPLEVEVTWIRRRTGVPEHLAIAAPPDIRAFHKLLRIDEAQLIRATPATLRTAEQFVGWSGGEGAFLHAYGDAGAPFHSLPFVQHWTRARRAGLRVALEDFCLAAAAAKQGRLRMEPGAPALHHGYHLDAASYLQLLERGCAAAGVRVITDVAAAALITDGRVHAVEASEERWSADLFVDGDGVLIDAVDPGGNAAAGPYCDREILASAAPLAPVPLYSRVAAHPAGYLTLLPLRDRTAVRLAYSSRHLSDDQAAALLPGLVGLRIMGQGGPGPVTERLRQRPWVGNCVAIGPAAGEPEPLDAALMLALQLAVGQLVLLWPVRRDVMPESAIYNDEIAGQRARIADFTAQHFHLNARQGEPFWDEARARPISPELRAKIDLFAARGKFAHGNHEAHVEDSWALCMAGHGLTPRSSDPQAAGVEEAALMAEFQRQLRETAAAVGGMETHADALARLARPAA